MDDHTEMDEILQAVWGGIQRRHPDVPDVKIPIEPLRPYPGCTVPPVALFKLDPEPTVVMTDVAVASPREVILQHLLHEAAHALAYARGVDDGTEEHHTKAFGVLAAELGLQVDDSDMEPDSNGYCAISLAAGTAEEYAEELRLFATAEEQVGT